MSSEPMAALDPAQLLRLVVRKSASDTDLALGKGPFDFNVTRETTAISTPPTPPEQISPRRKLSPICGGAPPAREWIPPSKMPRTVTSTIGWAAGVAGGEIPLHVNSQLARVSIRAVLRVVFGICSICISVILVPLAMCDCISYVCFYAASIYESHREFVNRALAPRRRASSIPVSPSVNFECDFERWARTPWQCANPINEIAFSCYIIILKLFCSQGLGLPLQRHSKLFRDHLSQYPPDFPVSCNDQIFGHDDPYRRFQLSMLFIVEKLSFEEVRQAFQQRWTEWEPKTRAVRGRRWGRSCFKVLRGKNFNLDDHIIHKKVDLSQTTLAQVISEMASEEMDAAKPQWQVWFIEPTKASAVVPPEGSALSAAHVSHLSYVCGKWNHIYADGSAMMASIVTRLGDKPVSMQDLPENYRRKVPWWQVFVYYGYHLFWASLTGLRLWCSWTWGTPPPAALIQSESDCLRRPRSITGVKCLSAPGVIEMADICKVRDAIQAKSGIRPTVNDLFAHCIAFSYATLQCSWKVENYIRRILQVRCREEAEMLKLRTPLERPKHVQTIIPMMCRTSVPTCMDNFTSMVTAQVPVPDVTATEENIVQDILTTKRAIDFVKKQSLRETAFVLICALCKALPDAVIRRLVTLMYGRVQVCCTNVAAPPIESRFFGHEVLGLFFWPAVPSMLTSGTSVVSLGSRFQILTQMDECELAPGIELAQHIAAQEGLLWDAELDQEVRGSLADILVTLVTERFEHIKASLLTS